MLMDLFLGSDWTGGFLGSSLRMPNTSWVVLDDADAALHISFGVVAAGSCYVSK